MHTKRIQRFLVGLFLVGLFCIPAAAPPADAPVSSDASPLTVNLTLSNYPGVGQPARVTCSVVGAWDMPNAVVEVTLPEGATRVAGDLKWSGDLKENKPVVLEATVVFHKVGAHELKATARAVASPERSWSNVAYVYLTVEADRGIQGLQPFMGDPRRVPAEQVSKGDSVSAVEGPSVAPEVAVPTPVPPAANPPSPKTSAVPMGTVTVTGRWLYYNRAGAQVGQNTLLTQLVRGDNDAHLAYAYTDSNGNFTFPAVTNPGTAGVKVRSYTYTKWGPSNYELMVVSLGGSSLSQAYVVVTSKQTCADGTCNVGTWSPVSPTTDANSKAWWGQADLNTAFLYPPNQPGGSKVEWSPASAHGTHYHPGGNIHLMSGDLDNYAHVLTHEYGHQIMYNRYGFFPTNDCPSPHYIEKLGGVNCGWTEGWANFYALSVLNDTSFRWPGGGSLNLETPSWFAAGWDDGDRVEGRVAGTLLDIKDAANDGYDQYTDGFNNVWATFYNQSDNTFSEFWAAWQARGYDLRRFRASAFQCTIDYDYKPRFALTWGATPADMDNHLWLPPANPSHVYYSTKGSLTAFPWANLDVDDANGYGPENTVIAKSYNGTYVIAGNVTSGNIAGTGAVMSYYLGPYLVTSWTVPGTGTGGWWKVATLNGFTGGYTTYNTVQSTSPAPY